MGMALLIYLIDASDRVPFGAGTIQGHGSAMHAEVTGFFQTRRRKCSAFPWIFATLQFLLHLRIL